MMSLQASEYSLNFSSYVSSLDSQEDVIFNMTAIIMFHWIVWGILSQLVVVFGISSNIINVVCFVKQGFKESINVSLTGVYCGYVTCNY